MNYARHKLHQNLRIFSILAILLPSGVLLHYQHKK